tara:strand:- start:86 stop:523 length:438 start_codon:yes stop_codon:yes gene_type:complete
MIKTFKGLIANATQHKISLSGGEEDKGFRISEFHVMPNKPITNSQEALVQIWKVKQDPAALSSEVDFSNDELLGTAIWSNNATTENYPEDLTVMFDDLVLNQDIYITCNEVSGRSMNYYLKLEEVTMSKGEQAVVNFVAALDHGR